MDIVGKKLKNMEYAVNVPMIFMARESARKW